jgi:hypothetical protein
MPGSASTVPTSTENLAILSAAFRSGALVAATADRFNVARSPI